MKRWLRPLPLGLIVLAVSTACVWCLARTTPSAPRPAASPSVPDAPPRKGSDGPAATPPALLAPRAPARHAPAPRRLSRAIDLRPQAIEKRLRDSVEYLASDELSGRGLGTRGIDLAAEYIAREFAAAGVKTDLFSQGPFQEFNVTQQFALSGANRAELSGPGGRRIAMELNKDYRPLSWSRAGLVDLPLVFAGYGITAPKLGYDDYAGFEAAGKAVIVLRHEPQQTDASSVFDGTRQTEHAYLARKVANAVEHGALGILLCTEHHSAAAPASGKASGGPAASQSDPLLTFAARGRPPPGPIFVMHCRRAAIEELVQSARGVTLAELERRIDRELAPQSFELTGWRVTGEVSMTQRRRSLKNVVGALDGSGDRAEEAIVVGAHYDHLGGGGITSRAPWKTAIHHGADDNASGTAVLIEVARQLSARDSQFARRLVFVAFTAEEVGLVGSEEYCGRPLVPLKKTGAMINLDMVGRLRRERLTVFGAETAQPFPSLVRRLASTYELTPGFQPAEFGPSDHLSFYQRRVPVLHFFTGLHADYHRPSDTADKLNYEGMRKITGLVADLAAELANAERLAPNRRAFDDFGLEPAPPARRTAYLGVTKDPAHRGPGYAVASVQKGSPAERAGLRAGDVILQIAGEEIGQTADLPERVRRRKPDDSVSLIIARGGTRLELTVVLGRR